jgi:pimeloyl-ACP methyl ester carboxylesterase
MPRPPAFTLPAVAHGFVERAAQLRLHHLDFGGEGTPTIFIHGVTGHAAAWSGVAPSLVQHGRCLALDLRGHGDSQWADDYATSTHAADVVAVLDALGLERAALVGSSWGALIALATASIAPDRVRRLALVDIEPSFGASETDVAPRPQSFADHAAVVAFERSRNPHAPPALIEIVAAMSVRPGEGSVLVPKFDPYFFARWPFRSDDWWSVLPGIAPPTLVVHAADSFVRGAVTRRMAATVADGHHVEIADCTHVVPVDAPAALVAVLDDFLD